MKAFLSILASPDFVGALPKDGETETAQAKVDTTGGPGLECKFSA
jgi:hypothetical protein